LANYDFLFASTTLNTVMPILRSTQAIPAVLWITGFLCLLNIALAILFRKNKRPEVISYYIAFVFQFLLFIAALLTLLGVISGSFFTLPGGLPFNQAEIGVALAIGIGLFPAAYWHRINVSELPKRIAEDGKTMNNNVRVRNSLPGEWMN
jgi:predicted membrane channel-forming protein YqfA (hemolysin III family)